MPAHKMTFSGGEKGLWLQWRLHHNLSTSQTKLTQAVLMILFRQFSWEARVETIYKSSSETMLNTLQ